MPVRHVLLDADGVMQDLRSGWEATFAELFGDRAEEFVARIAMDGLDIVVDERSRALVHRLRERGLGVHLATNQNPERRDHTRDVLEYDGLFDSSF
ncbi:hypothetical protein K8W59_03480 [Nocardioides rotundus]|uniref:hypothetical protein n=1 Tax=Nocardioides rotundus TaxID=1774216 RepID=UPI001CBC539D|nr:hypothetical protein [Nocardioides rotundus]UAL30596.1 hypothetical protein K8W59_03480 [Nocardioides rotundus]